MKNINNKISFDASLYIRSNENTLSNDGLTGLEKIEFYNISELKRRNSVHLYHKGILYIPKELSKRIVSELLLEIKEGLE